MSNLCLNIAADNFEIFGFFQKLPLMLFSSQTLDASNKHHFMSRGRILIRIHDDMQSLLNMRVNIIKLRVIKVKVIFNWRISIVAFDEV